MIAGTPDTTLIVIRGNSGSGKTTLATSLQRALGQGTALIQQDVVRRSILGGGGDHQNTADLIEVIASFCLNRGKTVIIEGILSTNSYNDTLERLSRNHAGRSSFYTYALSFNETVRRHTASPKAACFSPEDMRTWYRTSDPLTFVKEHRFTIEDTLNDALRRILADIHAA